MDARRAVLPGAAPRVPRGRPRRCVREDVRGPALGGAARPGSAPHRRRFVGRVQRALLRAPARAASGRRRPVRRRRRSFAALHLARGLRRRDPCAVRSPAPALPARCGSSRDAARPSSSHRSRTTRRFRSPTAGGSRSRSWRSRRDSRLRPRPQWLPLWIGAIALLGFTRDSAWIPILAVGWCAFRYRSRSPVTLFVSGVVAALPAMLLFKTPVRELLALLVNDSEPSSRHVVGVHRRPLSGRTARARAGQRRVPATRRVVHGGLSSSAACSRCS